MARFGRGGLAALAAVLLALAAACGTGGGNGGGGGAAPASPSPSDGGTASASMPPASSSALSGNIEIDGSSTVYPITEAVAEEYGKEQPGVRVTVGVSGTGGGFKRFCNGETDISNASRPIKDEEKAVCLEKGIEFFDLKIAFDGLSVVVNRDNDFVDHLTVEELARIFNAENPAKTWNEVRDSFPAEPIKVYSPGADSGTFDYFNEEILGKKGVRQDATFSEDDNTLVTGVAGDRNAIGFFGYAYYEENKDRLKVVPIDAGAGPVAPSFDTIKNGQYSPLSRPVFIYVSKAAYERPEVKDFVRFYIDNVKELAAEVGYIPLPDEEYAAEQGKL
ncbi:MAG: phosphate ABC transporter substrate-binding protein [Chlorobi bacterium NICIL-2]|nr:MAG: phosphate ABC transporter substrate-binding protein [Chlorobi bacterium NICIL-2]